MEGDLENLMAASASLIQEAAGGADITMLVTDSAERHTRLLTTLSREEAYRIVEMTARRLELKVKEAKEATEH